MSDTTELKDDPRLITFSQLRKAIGWLGILLPLVLFTGLYFLNQMPLQSSISQYYYTRMGSYLTGTLCAVALFLFAYKGYPGFHDNTACNIAAIFGLGIAFIPMEFAQAADNAGYVFYSPGNEPFRVLHYIFAALFFLTLAFISFHYFTMSKGEFTPRKKIRNRLYKICSIIIFLAIVSMAFNFFEFAKPAFREYKLLFAFESVALLAFGISWLVKGEALAFLNDKPKAIAGQTLERNKEEHSLRKMKPA